MTCDDIIRMALEHFGAVLQPSDMEVKLAMLAVAAERERYRMAGSDNVAERTVIDVCNRLGIHAALELNDQSNNELDDEVRS